ncbi:MAG: hypothetical protein C5B50_29165 [Verrucomicrobia bacterium]|nr:MAG: hypothetical protein C5B50_29165 [Verrucomicrobiota bacterium]
MECASPLALFLFTIGGPFSLWAQTPPLPPAPPTAPDTNEISRAMERVAAAAAISELTTNDAMLPEDLFSPDSPDQPGDEIASTNAPPSSGTNMTADATSAYTPRSGRQSRSRRYSRQKSGQSNSSGSGYGLDSTNSTGFDYGAFRVVADKNIFNPNRRPGYTREIVRYTPRRDPQYFTLVGTMSYEKGTFAFFNGTSSEYQKALKTSDTIAGYKLTGISSDSVNLARETNEVQLKVGMQMRLEDDGSWQVSNRPHPEPPPATPSTTSNVAASATSNSPATAENESDVIKRMRARRGEE